MEIVAGNGWDNNVRLANDEVELLVTTDVGPRVIRFGFIGGPNMFAEWPGQQGGRDEDEWMIRGGHRLWIAPEERPLTYELDNLPVRTEEIPGGVRTIQDRGPLSGIVKTMEITLAPDANRVRVSHSLRNEGSEAVVLAPWALSVMAQGGVAVIPLPAPDPNTERLGHNQEWSIWGYTDLTDPRWTLGSRYVLLRQDPQRGRTKLGIRQREGWAAYSLNGALFVKRFPHLEDAVYPDGGVNFEIYSDENFLEIESLGPLVALPPGGTAVHEEQWSLAAGVSDCMTEADVDANIIPAIEGTILRPGQ